ncbi:MAG: LTA synthase family protein [Candidatus Izimaplasma sp.]|nr:LTA synthase family protein [Candidatus Izimaplasma bacterium]
MFISLQTIDQNVELKNSDETESISDIAKTLQLISYSDRDLYTYMYNSSEALKKFGLITYTQRDFFTLFRSDPLTQDAYEILLDDYYKNKYDHNNNIYTDIFEDKNLILIMAESLDTFAINKVLTPNLWYLKENYGYFENFYAPLYYRSTADSEFLVQTSMFPDKNVTLSMETYLDNEFPNTLPKLFQEQGYSTYSFHNYTDYFYPRSQFHINTLGYNQYWGSEELGLSSNFEEDSIIFNHTWESDFEMMELAVEKFIYDDRFFVNMLTVSGHFPYNDSHEMAKEEYLTRVDNYFDSLEDPVEVDESIKYYLAVTMEFDKAIGYLMDRLDETNRLKDTVIMIFGDHYAYGLDNKDIWDYTNKYKPDDDMMNIHKVPFLLINEDPLLKGTTSNYMSTIDILPTVSNLFGLDANMKLFYGSDALSSRRNIIRFANGSFLSKDFKYNALSEEYTVFNNLVTKQYISEINRNFMNDYMYNLLTLKYDYYDKE